MNYGKISRQVDLALRHTDKPCIGEECDGEDNTCKRHDKTAEVVMRLTRHREGLICNSTETK